MGRNVEDVNDLNYSADLNIGGPVFRVTTEFLHFTENVKWLMDSTLN